MIRQDIPPYLIIGSDPTRYAGLNLVGLRRRGFSNEDITQIKEIYSVIYNSKLNLTEAKAKIQAEFGENQYAKIVLDFIESSNRGILLK